MPTRTVPVAVAAVAVLVVAARVAQVRSSPVWGDDLAVFWGAAHALDTGGDPWVRGFDYLPSALLGLAPSGLLPFRVARELWLAGGVALVAGSTLVAVRRSGATLTALALVVTFLAFPTLSALQFANLTLVELPVLVAAGVAAQGERWGRVALLLGVGTALKPVLVPCLLVLVVHRRWRELVALAAGLVAASTAVLLVVGDVGGWSRELRAGLATAAADPASADLGAHLHGVARVAVSAAVVAAGAWVVVHRPAPAVLLGVPLLVSFLVGPVAWAHYPLLLLPLVVALVTGGGAGRACAAAAVALLVSVELVAGHLERGVPAASLFALVTGALLLLLVGAASAGRPAAAGRDGG